MEKPPGHPKEELGFPTGFALYIQSREKHHIQSLVGERDQVALLFIGL